MTTQTTQTDPLEVNAIATSVLKFMSENSAVSLEIQAAALRAAAETIDQAMVANNSAQMKQSMGMFWQRRNK